MVKLLTEQSYGKKPWYRSRTYWFNLLSTAMVVLSMPEVGAVLPEELLKWVLLATALGNMYLRDKTGEGTTWT